MQILLNGLISGIAIAMMGLAFTVVYLPTRVFYVAIAGGFAAAPFLVLALMGAGWPVTLALICAAAAVAAFSLATEISLHSRLEARGASPAVHLMASLGLYIIVIQLLSLTWGSDAKALRVGRSRMVEIGTVTLSSGQLAIAVGGAVALAAFFGWLNRSRAGLTLRALADNPDTLALLGYNTSRLRRVAFGLSGAMAGISALLVASDTGFSAHGGLPALLFGVVAAVLGGRHSFVGPLLGGLLLGIVRTGAGWTVSARWQDAVVFALLAAFLLLRPEGITGRRLRADAAY
ncbi:MAG TPA: branched-chain amino acid ABC transporter permease [Longimicrobium sp.]|jgi:branched-chain amino acid transport system permease protein|nr:branched-chain amino acid ABC transporter permease [Longimicrobium sp.]